MNTLQYVPAVETVEAVRYDDDTDPADLAAWCGGKVQTFPWDERPMVVTPLNHTLGPGSYLVKRGGAFHVWDAERFATGWREA